MVVGGCGAAGVPANRAPDIVVAAAPSTSPQVVVANEPARAAPVSTCGPQPNAPPTTIDPTCGDVTLRDGRSFHDQLTLQLSSGATTRIDCPRMRFHDQDTPVCVAKKIGGRVRGACCPPGRADPTDPDCVSEGTVDEMYKRQKVWEWCNKSAPPSRPCEPCVWVTGER
jgi:hypothetical protein